MLASITPFGERGRNNRWGLTVGAYVVGSVLGGALVGVVLGLVGQVLLGLVPSESRTAVALVGLAIAAAVGLALDLGIAGLHLPTIHRQVDERWIDTYRGWVYGLGFGFQLGVGVMTIVSSSLTYVVLVAELLSGSWVGGLVIGTTFGLARAVPQLRTRTVTDPARLRGLIGRSQQWLPRASRAALAAQGAAAVVAVAILPGVI